MRKAGLILVLLLAGLAKAAAAPAPAVTLEDVRQVLVGTWQSADDTRLTRELDADGRSVERYDGDTSATAQGAWAVFTGKTAPAAFAPYKPAPTGVYLELKENDDVMLYAVSAISLSAVELVYLQDGKPQRFTRID
jgi:hypothetical protein